MDHADIRHAVEQVLGQWTGFRPLQEALQRRPGIGLYLGGGVVRQAMLGEPRKVKDFDLFIDGPEIESFVDELALAGRVDFGPYGSPRWMPAPEGSPYADIIPIRRFTNGLGPCHTMVDILNQVDFTLNAVAVDLRTGEVFDPQGAWLDAQRREMRAVRFDRPHRPIRPEIPVTHRTALWHRLVHYASVLNLRIEPVTRQWLRTHRPSESETAAFAQWFFTPVHDLEEGPEPNRAASRQRVLIA